MCIYIYVCIYIYIYILYIVYYDCAARPSGQLGRRARGPSRQLGPQASSAQERLLLLLLLVIVVVVVVLLLILLLLLLMTINIIPILATITSPHAG